MNSLPDDSDKAKRSRIIIFPTKKESVINLLMRCCLYKRALDFGLTHSFIEVLYCLCKLINTRTAQGESIYTKLYGSVADSISPPRCVL